MCAHLMQSTRCTMGIKRPTNRPDAISGSAVSSTAKGGWDCSGRHEKAACGWSALALPMSGIHAQRIDHTIIALLMRHTVSGAAAVAVKPVAARAPALHAWQQEMPHPGLPWSADAPAAHPPSAVGDPAHHTHVLGSTLESMLMLCAAAAQAARLEAAYVLGMTCLSHGYVEGDVGMALERQTSLLQHSSCL